MITWREGIWLMGGAIPRSESITFVLYILYSCLDHMHEAGLVGKVTWGMKSLLTYIYESASLF